MFKLFIAAAGLVVAAHSISALAAGPVLPLGTTYTYDYCFQSDLKEEICSDSTFNKSLTIAVLRLEVTAGNPSSTYVFQVNNDGRIYEVRIDQALWDAHILNMVRTASSSDTCEANARLDLGYHDEDQSGLIWDGRPQAYCAGGADYEDQSAVVKIIPVASPMPFSMSGGGYWPSGDGSEEGEFGYEWAKNYYRDHFAVATEYLEFLGLPYGPDSSFNVQFKLTQITSH